MGLTRGASPPVSARLERFRLPLWVGYDPSNAPVAVRQAMVEQERRNAISGCQWNWVTGGAKCRRRIVAGTALCHRHCVQLGRAVAVWCRRMNGELV